MPDLVTHVTLAHLFRRMRGLLCHRQDSGTELLLFYWGTILPDILTRPFFILFPKSQPWVLPFHTPMAMLICSLMLAMLFPLHLRRSAFLNLFGGAMFHFFIDLFQKQVIGNHFWLYPFSWASRGLGLAWPHEIMNLIPLWLILFLALDRKIAWKTLQQRTHKH